MITILGAGLAGLSCSYHLGHNNCTIFEACNSIGGHARTYNVDGFLWDEGPHVSFTSQSYVKALFEKSVEIDGLREFQTTVTNYANGSWIPHPAQSNLASVPQPLRDKIFNDFIASRVHADRLDAAKNYADWLRIAFGPIFTEAFPARYTRKYWATDAAQMDVDWIGQRLFLPDADNVKRGYNGTIQNTHYIQKVRYPNRDGFSGFLSELSRGAQVRAGHKVVAIDLQNKTITFESGLRHKYDKLISTIPLPELVRLADAPHHILEAAGKLECTSLLLINVTADHEPLHDFHWMYVYDEDFLSTRITSIGNLANGNVPPGKTGIQVEIYGSRAKPLPDKNEAIARVAYELVKMGLIKVVETVHARHVSHANVIFDLNRRAAQNEILNWLSQFGLTRSPDDLEPTTNWKATPQERFGELILAGRFGQWKYFWSDDCVLRGRQIAQARNTGMAVGLSG